MRTEIKVGLIIGLVVIAGGGIIWSLNRGGEAKADLPFDARAGGVGAGGAQPVRHETPAPQPTARDARPAQPSPRPTTPPPSSTPPSSATPRTTTPPAPAGATPTGGGNTTTPPRAPDTGSPPAGARPSGAPTTTPPTTPPTGAPDTRTPTTPGSADKPATNPPVSVPPRSTPAATDAPAGARPAATEKPSPATTYTVADTDTLSTIARDKYGDVKYWTAIVTANPGINPDHIRVGQVINLPAKEDVLSGKATSKAEPAAPADSRKTGPTTPAGDSPRTESTPPVKPAAGRTYKVAKGDTLTSIARTELKDENRYMEIYELNKDRLASPDSVIEGMELKLPEK